jgi:uncharacterized membrane protein YozB (DUF420 family)
VGIFVFFGIIALHAGIPLVVSQTSLTMLFVVLGIIVIGVGYGLINKNKEGFKQHRYSMTIATGLALTVILLVMLPAAFNFYIDTDLEFFSQLSILTLIHGAIGAPAIVLGLTYAFGDLPKKTKKWMRWAILFWAVSLVLGVMLFLDMQDLLSFSMQM